MPDTTPTRWKIGGNYVSKEEFDEYQRDLEALLDEPDTPVEPSQLDRIERKLDTLIAALAEEDDEPDPRTLDGETAGSERDQTQSL